MDLKVDLHSLWSVGSAVLPTASAVSAAVPVLWAVVLAGVGVRLAATRARSSRLVLAGAIIFWCLLPGQTSPVFWLGLAFQAPSLTSALIGLCWLGATLRRKAPPTVNARAVSVIGVLLGWVLMVDTLALLPVSIYAWGFEPGAVVFAALVAALIWAILGTLNSALPFLALLGYVASRLPTGNLWDALLDPWLWMTLQLGCLFNWVRGLRQSRWRATTRA